MSGEGYFGWRNQSASGNEGAVADFQMQQALAQVRTTQVVKVIAVHGGGTSGYPTVDVQIVTNQTDGIGTKTDHGIIYGIAVSRSHGGNSAIINDPKVGDVGMMSMADRDISAVKANNGAPSNPGSKRMHDPADGIYHGRMFQAAPLVNWVMFTDDGVVIQSGSGKVTINGVTIDTSGNILTPGGVTAGAGGGDSVTLQHHKHPTAAVGAPSEPTAGT